MISAEIARVRVEPDLVGHLLDRHGPRAAAKPTVVYRHGKRSLEPGWQGLAPLDLVLEVEETALLVFEPADPDDLVLQAIGGNDCEDGAERLVTFELLQRRRIRLDETNRRVVGTAQLRHEHGRCRPERHPAREHLLGGLERTHEALGRVGPREERRRDGRDKAPLEERELLFRDREAASEQHGLLEHPSLRRDRNDSPARREILEALKLGCEWSDESLGPLEIGTKIRRRDRRNK